ncbi:MAG: hypothetical protein ACKOFZ_02875 [Ilumatobacteraceae bacterium]
MKHVRVALIGGCLIAGIPLSLLTKGMTPVRTASSVVASGLVPLHERAIGLIVMAIWLVWLWSLVAVVVELWVTRRSEAVIASRNRLIALFVASLWTLLASSRSTPVSSPSTAVVVDVDPSPVGRSDGLMPLASVQTALIADYMLRRFAEARARVTRRMVDGCEVAPGSRVSEFCWRSLRLQVEDSNAPTQGIPVGVDETGSDVVVTGTVEVIAESGEVSAPVVEHLALATEAVGVVIDGDRSTTLIHDANGWRLSTGERIRPFGLSVEDKQSFSRLMAECRGMREVSSPARAVPGDWLMCVRLLGPIEARWADDSEVRFRKSKPLELLTWLVTHPDRPTRAAARTAMWMVDVQSSYFNNVVSELRAVLGDAGRFELLDKTAQDRLVLDERVVSDADILRHALTRFRTDATDESRLDLQAALSLVRSLPFAGSDYLWPDPEGITSRLVHLVMSASLEFAEDARGRGDVDGVYFATDRGLRMFPGDEELLNLRASVLRQGRPSVRGGRSG